MGSEVTSVQNTPMLIHPEIHPVALQLGPLAIHWYGLTYLAAFGLFFYLATLRLKHQPYASITGAGAWSKRDIEDILFLGVMGVVIGGRVGYCLFYKPTYYASHPLEIFYVWQGGMSFHGGLIGVLVSQWWFARTRQRPWLQVMDFIAPCVPTGLAAGRAGNFMNGELWGRVADPALPWGMLFRDGGPLPRHPSQIYQFLLEGLLLFILLWLYARKPRNGLGAPTLVASRTSLPPKGALLARGGPSPRNGQVSGAFLFGYGVFRFIAEFFREPDAHLGILQLGMSMGQWLCVPMILGGIAIWVWASKRRKKA